MYGGCVDQDDTGGRPHQVAPGGGLPAEHPPRQPLEPETVRDAGHSDTAQRQDHPEATGREDAVGERDEEPREEEEEDAGEEGRQEGGQNAVRHLAHVHHHVDPVQRSGAVKTGDGVECPDPAAAVGFLLLLVLH